MGRRRRKKATTPVCQPSLAQARCRSEKAALVFQATYATTTPSTVDAVSRALRRVARQLVAASLQRPSARRLRASASSQVKAPRQCCGHKPANLAKFRCAACPDYFPPNLNAAPRSCSTHLRHIVGTIVHQHEACARCGLAPSIFERRNRTRRAYFLDWAVHVRFLQFRLGYGHSSRFISFPA